MKRALLLALLLGCGETIHLDGPKSEWPEPACEAGEVLDPDDGVCRLPYCEWDEDCPEGHRCDLVEGRCAAVIR